MYSFFAIFLDGGYWIFLEIMNIPWNESLLDFNSEYFDKTKLLIESAVRLCQERSAKVNKVLYIQPIAIK